MPLQPRLPFISQAPTALRYASRPVSVRQVSLLPPSLPFLSPFQSFATTHVRSASILSKLSDTPGSRRRQIRRGRGPASGKGKTSGRGSGGQKQHGGVPARFTGGQTPEEIVHGKHGFTNIFAAEMTPINIERIQQWIDLGRIDPKRPITVHELVRSRCVHGIEDGIKLLGLGGKGALKQPIHIVVSRASATAIEAVEAAGGTIVTRYYTPDSLKRVVAGLTHPYASMNWDPSVYKIGSETSSPLVAAAGYRYRLPDPTKRTDIEYYRDPAHRGYLSHLVGENESPSLFFMAPIAGKQQARGSKVQKLPENRVW